MLGVTLRWSRLAVAAALIAASGGVAVMASAPANAAPTGCTYTRQAGYRTSPSPQVYGFDVTICTPDLFHYYWVTISKLVSGTWKVVATGSGSAVYNCNGSAENEYNVSSYQLNDTFNAPCG